MEDVKLRTTTFYIENKNLDSKKTTNFSSIKIQEETLDSTNTSANGTERTGLGMGAPHTDVVCGEEHSRFDEKLGGGVHTEPTYDDDALGGWGDKPCRRGKQPYP